MCRKLIVLISFVAVLGLTGNAFAVIKGNTWWGGWDANSWNDPNNWSDGNVPDGNHALKFYLANTLPTAQYGVVFVGPNTIVYDVCGPAWWSDVDGLGEQTLTIDSNTLTVINNVRIAQWGTLNGPSTNSGRIVVNSGATMDIGGYISVGHFAAATVDVNGGTINITGNLDVPSSGAQHTGEGTVNLKSGTIRTGTLGMYPATKTGLIDIEAGTLIIDGNVVSTVNSYVSAGQITSYGGGGFLDINVVDGNTVVTAAPADQYARFPSPSSPIGDITLKIVDVNVVLKWLPGDDANTVYGQDVYFGTDFNDVRDAVIGSSEYLGRQTPNSIDVTALVQSSFGDTYFWRVDEVNGFTANVWKRLDAPWSFTMPDGILIDDFEDYDTTSALENAWGNFKQPGNPTWTVVTLAQAPAIDSNSMKFKIVNSVGSPGYSDTNTVFDPNQDWTAYGLKALAVSFYGTAGNVAQKLYMEVKDSYGSTKAVLYSGDANDVNEEAWHTFNVALSDFTGVDINHVAMLTIRASDTTPGFEGESIYIDNVMLYPPRCVPAFGPDSDFAGAEFGGGDCVVDNEEIAVLNSDWLDKDKLIYPNNPDANKLVLHYKFDYTDPCDPNVKDETLNDYNGIVEGTQWFWDPIGHDGNCIDMNGNGVVYADPNVWPDLDSNNLTVSCWLNMDPRGGVSWKGWIWQAVSTDPAANHPPCMGVRFWVNSLTIWGSNPLYWHAWGFAIAGTQTAEETMTEMEGQWHHFAFVKDYDASKLRTYYDGVLVKTATNSYDRFGGLIYADEFIIANNKVWSGGEPLEGKIDEFRIYEYALSDEQIVSLAEKSSAGYTVISPANLVDDGIVNFKDYAVIADDWLEEKLFPAP